jgi:glycosyltransferase involved in cell wall biosynthesis
MSKIKISVYAISKNEEKFVQRFCESAKEADEILILDTGSTDNTVSIARQSGAKVHECLISPWRFDIARNTALSLVDKNIDVCISLDLDEVLEPGWRQEIEQLWKDGVNRISYKFYWGHGKEFYSTKIHSRKGFRWHHPVHEYIVPDRVSEKYASTNKRLVTHYPDATKSRGQYLDLLELAVKEDPRCPRNAFYYARELTYYSKWDEAIIALEKYLGLPEALWKEERCYAMRLLGKSYLYKADSKAEGWFIKACAEAPQTREPWVDLSDYYLKFDKFKDTLYYAEKALTITNRQFNYVEDPSAWGYKPYDLIAVSSWFLGDREKAILNGKKAIELNSSDERLRNNLYFFTLNNNKAN